MKKIIGILAGVFCLTVAVSAQTPTPENTAIIPPKKTTHTPLKKKSKSTVKAQSTPVASPVPTSGTISSAPQNGSTWTKSWTDKYVIVTPKSEYTHVLIDVETLGSSFEGAGMHSAAALEALALAQSTGLLNPAVDLVKVDVVLFQNRDNYGAPMWDSMKRFAHFEFSLQKLSKASADAFQKPEADWKGLFQSVLFY